MNNQELTVINSKSVNFLGDELLAVQTSDGQIFVGISAICYGIGLNKNMKDRQVKKIQKDSVLNSASVIFAAGVFDPNHPTLAIKIDYLPLWLAKISITPNMQKEQPELSDRLVEYQLKVKDVLAEAFTPQYTNTTTKPLPHDYQNAA